MLAKGYPIDHAAIPRPDLCKLRPPPATSRPTPIRPAGAGDRRCAARLDDRWAHRHGEPAGRCRRPQHPVAGNADEPAEEKLLHMFVTVAVRLPVRKKVIAIPATAVLYAPYGDSVFVVTTPCLLRPKGKREGRRHFLPCRGGRKNVLLPRLEGGTGDSPAVRPARRKTRRLVAVRRRAEGRSSSAPASSNSATVRRWRSSIRKPCRSAHRPSPGTADPMKFTDLFIRRPVSWPSSSTCSSSSPACRRSGPSTSASIRTARMRR